MVERCPKEEVGSSIRKCEIFSLLDINLLEHLHPDALKGLGKPFDAALEKSMPHPST